MTWAHSSQKKFRQCHYTGQNCLFFSGKKQWVKIDCHVLAAKSSVQFFIIFELFFSNSLSIFFTQFSYLPRKFFFQSGKKGALIGWASISFPHPSKMSSARSVQELLDISPWTWLWTRFFLSIDIKTPDHGRPKSLEVCQSMERSYRH